MARLLTCGFEAGAIAAETGELGGLEAQGTAASYSTAQVRSGTGSILLSGGSSGAGSNNFVSTSTIPVTSSVVYYGRIAVYASAIATTGDQCVLGFVDTAHATGARLVITPSAVEVLDRNTGSVVASGSAISTGAWHVLEIEFAPYAGTFTVEVDGTTSFSGTLSVPMSASTGLTLFVAEEPTGTCTVYCDDVALNDNTGTAQNSWCGQGQVVMLLPVADSSRTGFTAGAGATTNLYDSVNNVPPNGQTRSGGVNGSQIIDNNNNATDNYGATMETYTAAGVPSGATVLLAEAVGIIGTSTAVSRNMGLQVTANPVIAETVGATAAAATGAYPTNWTTTNTAYSYAPSVTLGTAPTVEVRKATAATTYAMCCFMGLLVEYLPASGPPPSGYTYLICA